MGNMSYCRFENTLRDLQDCVNAIESGDYNEDGIQGYELDAVQELLETCRDFLDLEDTIDNIIESNED